MVDFIVPFVGHPRISRLPSRRVNDDGLAGLPGGQAPAPAGELAGDRGRACAATQTCSASTTPAYHHRHTMGMPVAPLHKQTCVPSHRLKAGPSVKARTGFAEAVPRNQRRSVPKVVEGAQVTGWKAAFGRYAEISRTSQQIDTENVRSSRGATILFAAWRSPPARSPSPASHGTVTRSSWPL